MFEGIKQRLRAVQYGDIETRRRWFFICVIGLFCAVLAAWISYVAWRGSFMAGWEGSVHSMGTIWGSATSQMRDAFK